jgi:hypothetical protein
MFATHTDLYMSDGWWNVNTSSDDNIKMVLKVWAGFIWLRI